MPSIQQPPLTVCWMGGFTILPFLAPFAASSPVFAAMATVFFYPHIFTGSVGRRILLVVPVDTFYRTSIISFSTVLPLNPFVILSLAPLYSRSMVQTLGCGPTVRSPRPHSSEGVGYSTTTTTTQRERGGAMTQCPP